MINNLLGWLMFVIALTVYTLTLEPSVSLWDCGEFISAAAKLQVVHPPGAPFFLMVGRFFSMFASSHETIAFCVNMLSAVASALTVLFTFWITTHFAKKMVSETESLSSRIAVFGSGIVAALALTFSDSFWFSAVEAEVYALSSFFTAITFWAALRWEESDSEYADKWIILIAYMIGLAIGTHLLNLLVIPAVVFIYYFKKFAPTRKGMIYSFLIGLVLLMFVQNGIIPGVPKLMSLADVLFVNSFGMGFNSGVIFILLLLVGGTAYGIYYFSKIKKNHNYHLALLCFAYILLGYSSYTMVVVRSMDNPPIDMNNPEEPNNLLSYINREQYGDRPLLYGPYFNADVVDLDGDGRADYSEGSAQYRKDSTEYTLTGYKRDYKFEKEYSTLFPRMGDRDKPSSAAGYRSWSGMGDITTQIYSLKQQMSAAQSPKERQEFQSQINDLERRKPSFGNNISYLVNYQFYHMYLRYFLWNFVGRQSDQQAHDYNRVMDGNWLSGVKFIDNMRLGPQDGMPESMANNMGRNKYYFIPLILGILGIVLHFKKQKNDATVTAILFVFTGILIIVFLNQPPYEPRERDYSLVGSFQTFCIWIGLGVMFIWDKLRSKMGSVAAAGLALVVSLSAPALMGSQGWDDHDRSGRYLGLDFAKDYLMSCPKNAVLFTNGDNDTYPLWYAQNVEGFRTDVRIINQSLLPTDWYSQVLLTKVYDSEPLPLTLKASDLKAGINDYFYYREGKKAQVPVDLSQFIKDLIKSGQNTYDNKRVRVPVDREAAIRAGLISEEDTGKIAPYIQIEIPGNGFSKGDLVLLDFIAQNAKTGWKRPICFSSTSGDDGFMGMQAYFVRKGLIFQMVPVRDPQARRNMIRMNDDVTYDLLMNKFKFSGIKEKPDFYLDDKANIVPQAIQNMFIVLAGDYLTKLDELKFKDSTLSSEESKKLSNKYRTRAIKLLDKCKLEYPERALPATLDTRFSMGMLYHEAGMNEQAEKEWNDLYEMCNKDISYFVKFDNYTWYNVDIYREKTKDAYDMLDRIINFGKQYKFKSADKWEKRYKEVTQAVNSFISM